MVTASSQLIRTGSPGWACTKLALLDTIGGLAEQSALRPVSLLIQAPEFLPARA